MPLCLAPHGLWPTRLLCPWDSPGKNIGVGSHSLLQGIFPTQGSNLGLLHCRQILYRLSHQGSLWRMCYLIKPSIGSGNKTEVCNPSFFNYWPWVFTPRVLVFLSVGTGNIDLSGGGGSLRTSIFMKRAVIKAMNTFWMLSEHGDHDWEFAGYLNSILKATLRQVFGISSFDRWENRPRGAFFCPGRLRGQARIWTCLSSNRGSSIILLYCRPSTCLQPAGI